MPNFALILVHGPGWDDSLGIREQADWTGHAAFMDGLVVDGLMLVGGPVGDGQQTMHVSRRATRKRSADASPMTTGPMPDCWKSARSKPGRCGSTSARTLASEFETESVPQATLAGTPVR